MLATLVVSVLWCIKYSLDDDQMYIKYKKYLQSKDNLFPVLSMCFANAVVEEKLKEYDRELNESTYIEFLSGNTFESKLMDISYNNVTLNAFNI